MRLLLSVVLSCWGWLFAGNENSTTLCLTIGVSEINEMVLTPQTISLSAVGTSGGDIVSALDSSTRLSLTTTSSAKRLLVSAPGLPANLNLKVGVNLGVSGVRVNGPAASARVADAVLTRSSKDAALITGLDRAVIKNAPLEMSFSASPLVGSINTSVLLTYTLTS